ncbi:MAG: alpha/beta hydrolase [Deltaproteobacteria bacterium]|nr:alpha/beta hydrolase [Deltaproteobacteria bacterium]MCB9787043.1 alpha/beta hydrolase [Deltaproteobacteria bacterium]
MTGEHWLEDGDERFAVSVARGDAPACAVLFAVGGGGSPERHRPLLSALVRSGCVVVAPHFDRLVSPEPSDGALSLRARRLAMALEAFAPAGLPVAGVGHSIGATMLLALAGGQLWTRAGRRLPIAPAPRLERLALLAPATGFFQAPEALDAVTTPILAWAGTRDEVTPPAQAAALARAMGHRVPVDIRIIEGAGHFSFMDVPPPHITDPLADRERLLADLAVEIGRFVVPQQSA